MTLAPMSRNFWGYASKMNLNVVMNDIPRCAILMMKARPPGTFELDIASAIASGIIGFLESKAA